MTQPPNPSAAALEFAEKLQDDHERWCARGPARYDIALALDAFAAQAVAAARVAWEQPTDESDLNLVPHRKITKTTVTERAKPAASDHEAAALEPNWRILVERLYNHGVVAKGDLIDAIDRATTASLEAGARRQFEAEDAELHAIIPAGWSHSVGEFNLPGARWWSARVYRDEESYNGKSEVSPTIALALAIIAAALAERGRVERERAAKIAEASGPIYTGDTGGAARAAAAIRNQTTNDEA